MIYITDSFCGKFSYLYTPWTFSLTKFLHGVLRMFQSIEKSVRWVTFIMSMLVFMFMAHAHHLLCYLVIQWMHCCGYLMTTTVNAFHDYYSECIAVVISTAAHRRGSRNIYQEELCIGDGSGDVYWTQSYNDCRKMYLKRH